MSKLSFQTTKMIHESTSRGRSPSCDSSVCGGGGDDDELRPRQTLTGRSIEIIPKQSMSKSGKGGSRGSGGGCRTPSSKKAKRCRFFRNGDKFFTGVVMAVTSERYRNFDSLAADLTRVLIPRVTLPNGVRIIYSMDGKKVQSIDELEDGERYVVSGQGELFKKIDYSIRKMKNGCSLSGLSQSPIGINRKIDSVPSYVTSRAIILVHHGPKPRKVFRLLLNERNATSLKHVYEAISNVIVFDCCAVKKVYTIAGKLIVTLQQFFESEAIFLVYGSEKSVPNDFDLDPEESKSIKAIKRESWMSKRLYHPLSKMSNERTLSAPDVESCNSYLLPKPLRMVYTADQVIGVGYFAVVRHSFHKQTGAEYAMKIVDKYKCQGREEMLANEVRILRKISHPNIIKLVDVHETPNELFLVTELVRDGDLYDAIMAVTRIPELEAKVIIRHLMSALAYLHSHQIVHRDVKPENILIELEDEHIKCVKLTDFGLAQVVKQPLYATCGTPTYVAPEILAERGYGLEVDVWSAGVILYTSLCGYPPFISRFNNQEELFELILSGKYTFRTKSWANISISAQNLIMNMLQVEPELRFTAEEVLNHPWLANSSLEDSKIEQTSSEIAIIDELTSENSNQSGQDRSDGIFDYANIGEYRQQNILFQQEDDVIYSCIDQWNDDEPVLRSVDCPQDTYGLSSSLNNLMKNMDDSNERSEKTCKSVQSSFNSIPDKIKLTEKNNSRCQSLLSLKLHSKHKRNKNSMFYSQDLINTPKSIMCNNINKTQPQSRILYNDNFKNATATTTTPPNSIIKDIKNKNISNSPRNYSLTGRLSQFYDGLSCSSDNNVETSDSFVNIKFSNISKEVSGSSVTRSTESSESFERIRLDNSESKKVYQSPKTPCTSGVASRDTGRGLKKKTFECTPIKYKSQRPLLSIAVLNHDQKQSVSKSMQTDKINSGKLSANEIVKLREKRSIPIAKRETKSERFSCLPKYSARKNQETCEINKKNHSVIVANDRKYSSTDEFKDEDKSQKKILKTNRYSLYYTPQLGRKTYECDNNSVEKSIKITNTRGIIRPTSWKAPETSEPILEDSETSERKINNINRRSVVGAVASRNKSSRQSVYLQSSIGKKK